MSRTKGEAGTGDVVEAVRHIRTVNAGIGRASFISEQELFAFPKEIQVPYSSKNAKNGKNAVGLHRNSCEKSLPGM